MVSVVALRPLVPRALLAAVAVSTGIHLIAVLVPGLRPVFQTFTMDAREWTLLLLLSLSIIPAVEVLKVVQRRYVH
jgi:Ca2+-transporting ATPase